MTPKPFKDIAVAVAGTGFIGPVHVEALRRLGITVRGILGSSPEKSKHAAAALGLERSYGTYEELLADSGVAAVHLATPNRLHVGQVLAALDAGKHVVCEKPLAMTSAEAGEAVAAAARYPHLVTAVNYNVRFYPLCLEARERIRQGGIGRIFHVQGNYLQDWLLFATDYNWRVETEAGGEVRAIGDIGTHWLDLICFVTGLEIEAVMADLLTAHPVRERPASGSIETFSSAAPEARTSVEIRTEDYGSVLLRFKGGARGAFTVSQVTAGRKNSIRFDISGSERALSWESERPNELWIGRRDGPNECLIRDPSLLRENVRPFANYPGGHNEGFPDSFKQLYRAIYSDISSGQRSSDPLYATFEDGRRELRLCEAILRSHREQRWVKV